MDFDNSVAERYPAVDDLPRSEERLTADLFYRRQRAQPRSFLAGAIQSGVIPKKARSRTKISIGAAYFLCGLQVHAFSVGSPPSVHDMQFCLVRLLANLVKHEAGNECFELLV